MTEQNGSAYLAWFLAGAAAGAAGALLLAPQSGPETREAIRRRALEGCETLEQRSREVYEKGRELYEKGKQIADEAAHAFERPKVTAGSEPAAPSAAAEG